MSSLDKVRTPRDVERKLVRHYLHTEGGGGAGSLRHIDASAPELQEALGTDTPESAIGTLLAACGEERTAHVLAHGWNGSWPDLETPGFFRFLVLTCAVVASADDNPESQDFGANLQHLYGTSRTFGQRTGLPNMWQALVVWSLKQQRPGASIRTVELPPPGAGIHIGLSNAISFPNWRDVLHLRGNLERIKSLAPALRTPSDVARVLCPYVRDHGGYSRQMVAASEEFHRLYMSSASLLYLHRFWAVVGRALGRVRPRFARDGTTVRVELQFGLAADNPSLRVSALDRDGVERETPSAFEADLERAIELLQGWRGAEPAVDRWRALLTAGAVAFVQERFGVWSASEIAPEPHDTWLYLVAASRMGKLRHLAVARAKSLSPQWMLVGPLVGKDALLVHRALGLDTKDRGETLSLPFGLEGGVRTRRGWLGRPTVLPWLYREGHGELSVVSTHSDKPGFDVVEKRPGRFSIRAEESLDGAYRIRLEESVSHAGTLAVEKTVRFVSDAPEHPAVGRFSDRWRQDPECRDESWVAADTVFSLDPRGDVDTIDESLSRSFDDFLEVVYARGRSGWSEVDLVAAIRELLPGPSPWDVMRALQEAGWLARASSVTWKATSWWLVEPYLVPVTVAGAPGAMLAGSAPAVIRRRLEETSAVKGGTVAVHRGVGALSPLTIVAAAVDIEVLARELGWRLQRPRTAAPDRAPRCWPDLGADVRQHRIAKEWDWREQRFLEAAPRDTTARVALTWWRRDEANRPDLYTVEDRNGRRFITSSRDVALTEAYRSARLAMLQLSDALLVRSPHEGHLPLHIATSLHLWTLRSSGPKPSAEGWTYAYAASPIGLELVRACLGKDFIAGFEKPAGSETWRVHASTSFGLARHRAPAARSFAWTAR